MAYSKRTANLYNPKDSLGFRLSRSKIDLFIQCPRCFYLDVRFGLKRPDSYPLTLNVAVDHLMKKEFDIHRAKGVAHPLMSAYKIDAVPYNGKEMDKWREVDFGRGGIHFTHKPTGFDVFGAVDDVWQNSNGELMVVDYKATSKKDAPTLEGSLGDQYKRQMEVYQWLLAQNGHRVSTTGYFVYVNGKKDVKAFDAKLEFDVSILPCKGETSWIEPTLFNIKKTLDSPQIPGTEEGCDYCGYVGVLGQILEKSKEEQKKTNSLNNANSKDTLF